MDPYTLPSRRTVTASVVMSDDDEEHEPRYIIKTVAVGSTVELVDDKGDSVGETSGIQMHIYGRTVV